MSGPVTVDELVRALRWHAERGALGARDLLAAWDAQPVNPMTDDLCPHEPGSWLTCGDCTAQLAKERDAQTARAERAEAEAARLRAALEGCVKYAAAANGPGLDALACARAALAAHPEPKKED